VAQAAQLLPVKPALQLQLPEEVQVPCPLQVEEASQYLQLG
jgi:hypothetical protein